MEHLNEMQVGDLISLGYDLHIHDQSGEYSDGLDCDEWERKERDRILLQGSPILSSEQDKRQCVLDCTGAIQKSGKGVLGKAEFHCNYIDLDVEDEL